MASKPNIVILENFSLFSNGIKSLLEREGIGVLGEALDWKELFDLAGTYKPDLLLLDLVHFKDSGIEILEKLRVDFPGIPLLIITNEEHADYFRDFILMGVNGFVYSNAPQAELIKAIERVAGGREYFPDGVFKIFKDSLQLFDHTHQVLHQKNDLTPRETSILKLFCNGMTYKEIGEKLFISPRTVETHRKKILTKLKIRSTAEMVKYAMLHHLI